jgi:Mg-chelatase subunit ChlD
MNNQSTHSPDSTHIAIILDRSGSMQSIRDDVIGGFNSFLETQRKEAGRATITVVQFDSENPYDVVTSFKPLAEAPELTRETYVPRAATPLFDALGRGINDLDAHLSALKAEERPGKVIFMVMTDGMENASVEFTKEGVQKLIKAKTDESGWQFVFLTADLAAMNEAAGVGFKNNSSLLFEKSARGSRQVWESVSQRTSEYRASRRDKMDFNPEDRKHPDDTGKE